MNIKKLNESLRRLLEDQYPNAFDCEGSLNESNQIKTKGTTGFEARILVDEGDDIATWKTYKFTAKDEFMALVHLLQNFDTVISADLEAWVNKENATEDFDEVFKLYYDGYMQEAVDRLSVLYKDSMDSIDSIEYYDDIYQLKYSDGRVIFENEELEDEASNDGTIDADKLTNICIIIDGNYDWLKEYGTFKSCQQAQNWLDKYGEEDWMYSQLTVQELKDLGIDEEV